MSDLASEPGSYARFFAQINGTPHTPLTGAELAARQQLVCELPRDGAEQAGIGLSVNFGHHKDASA